MQHYFSLNHIIECLIHGNVWTSKLINCIINGTRISIISIPLATRQWVKRSHNVFYHLTTPRCRNKDSSSCKGMGKFSSCHLRFKSFLSWFVSPASFDWVVSTMRHYRGELLKGSVFKDNKSLKGQRKTNAKQAVWVFVALLFFILFCRKCCWECLSNSHPAFWKKRHFLVPFFF